MQDQVHGQHGQTAIAAALANAGLTPNAGDAQTSGAVNFDAGIVREDEKTTAAELDSKPSPEPTINIGGTRVLGTLPEQPVAETEYAHTISASLCLTLNSGFTIVSGLKSLKCVGIDREDGKGEVDWNLYNPFTRQNDQKNTAEGLLRKTFGSIAKTIHSIVGRNVVLLGRNEDANAHVEALVENVRNKIVNKIFPIGPEVDLCVVPVEVDGEEVPRTITFGELFQVNTWVVHSIEDDAPVVNHNITFNIVLNVPAFYDSREPHVFVSNARSYMERALTGLGVVDYLNFSVIVTVDGTDFITDERTRNLVDMLVDDMGYYAVSKSAIADGTQDWIRSGDVNKLFGYGCDIALISPAEEEAAGDVADDDSDGE